MKIDKRELKRLVSEYTDWNTLSYRATQAFTSFDVHDIQSILNGSKEVLSVIKEVVDLIEKIDNDVKGLSSKDKMDAAVDLIDDLIQFNWIIELADDRFIRWTLTTIVNERNEWFGKDWGKSDTK